VDPLFAGLVLGALGSGAVAVRLMLPERTLETASEPEPEPLMSRFRLHEALALNVFPRQADSPCSSCNARVLVWAKDERRHDAWVGSCRRCGIARVDVVAGVPLER
jgi:hypothetical protein